MGLFAVFSYAVRYWSRERLSVHVHHAENAQPKTVLLRLGKTPSGPEVRSLIKHLIGRICHHWPHTRLTLWGASHFGCAQARA